MGDQARPGVQRPADRLDSWKEIAAYLGRSERTVRRWEEKAGLPVRRLQHEQRGSVYALRTELDSWWESRRKSLETVEVPAGPAAGVALPQARWRVWVWAAAAVTVAIIATIVWRNQPPGGRASPPSPSYPFAIWSPMPARSGSRME